MLINCIFLCALENGRLFATTRHQREKPSRGTSCRTSPHRSITLCMHARCPQAWRVPSANSSRKSRLSPPLRRISRNETYVRNPPVRCLFIMPGGSSAKETRLFGFSDTLLFDRRLNPVTNCVTRMYSCRQRRFCATGLTAIFATASCTLTCKSRRTRARRSRTIL